MENVWGQAHVVSMFVLVVVVLIQGLFASSIVLFFSSSFLS